MHVHHIYIYRYLMHTLGISVCECIADEVFFVYNDLAIHYQYNNTDTDYSDLFVDFGGMVLRLRIA